ncbi:MAG: LysM peptidoglycan-binding domain-containing protein [Xanthomonadales bacterium]|nr:LysM peptidoglycan-binding domain-containing protein [Xanthomonadales bacterium]
MKIALFAILACTLVGCAGPPPKPASSTGPSSVSHKGTPDGYYRVRSGDNLSAVAFKFSLDWRDIARLNNISAPYIIYPDQELRLTENINAAEPGSPGPGSSPAASTGAAAGPSGVQTTAVPAPGSSTTRTVETPRSTTATIESPATDTPAESPPGSPSSPTDAEASSPDMSSPAAGSAHASSAPAAGGAAAIATQAPSSTAYAAPGKDPSHWMWPTDGRVISRFQANDPARKGIDIGGSTGQAVVASAHGQVVYSGNGLLGYGELVIIKHSDRMLSAYAHNSKRLVSEGQQVTAGSQIAEMGTNDRKQPELHFEIRVNGSPQDPLKYLPQR